MGAEAGGQNIVIDVDYSDTCMAPDLLNLPLCVGNMCNQDDIDSFGDVGAIAPDIPNCSASSEVTSLDGTTGLDIDASEVCIDSMTNIFFESNVYDEFDEAILDEDTGEFTGDLSALAIFSDECELTGGRLVLGTVVYNDGCEEDGISSVPMCVAKTCDNEEAVNYMEFFFGATAFEPDCGDVTVGLAEMDTSSKSTKNKSKKTIKSKKNKSTKAPKHAKGNKSTKAQKHAKGNKSTKAQKHAKGK